MNNPAFQLQYPGLPARPSTSSRIRVSRWRGNPYVAQLNPARSSRQTETLDVVQCLESLQMRGVQQAVTPALSGWDAQPFLSAGFELHEHLHLLSKPFGGLTDVRPRKKAKANENVNRSKIRRGQRWHYSGALVVDQMSFESFWQFDKQALIEARRATPTNRFRVVMDQGKVIAYAVHGRAAQRGYLQRLAVMPGYEGRSIGTALVEDGFDWLQSKGATEVLVNTQEHNHRALSLYEHLGFKLQSDPLSVLVWNS